MALPKSMALRAKCNNNLMHYLSNKAKDSHSYQCMGCNKPNLDLTSPLAKLDVLPSSSKSNIVHIRCSSNGKYLCGGLKKAGSDSIAATADTPEEDLMKDTCTLFEYFFLSPDTVQLKHVRTGRYLMPLENKYLPDFYDVIFAFEYDGHSNRTHFQVHPLTGANSGPVSEKEEMHVDEQKDYDDEKEKTVERLKRELEEKDKEIKERDEAIRRKDEEVKAKDEEIAKLKEKKPVEEEGKGNEKEKEMKVELEKKDKEIRERDEVIKRKDEEIAKLKEKEAVAEERKDKEVIEEMKKEMEVIEEMMKRELGKDEVIKGLEDELGSLRGKVDKLKNALTILVTSAD